MTFLTFVAWVLSQDEFPRPRGPRRRESPTDELRQLLPEARSLVNELRRLVLVQRAALDAGHQD